MSLLPSTLPQHWPAELLSAVQPSPVTNPSLLLFNHALAQQLGLPADVPLWAGNALPAGLIPLATAYGGHQFGHWAHRLGDGRALLLGEAQGPDGPWEVQLKGAGPTPYSRGADGRAVLRSSIREYLASEAMQALGIPTTRALALVSSPSPVRREQLETAAIVTRAAPSFARFGHLEWCAALEKHDWLFSVANHVMAQHYPAIASGDYRTWLAAVIERTAALMAAWQSVGFCHGVMNTDNFSLLGLTLDYGPYGFLDHFDANHICNHSDEGGRYAYSQQPNIGQWNCAQLLSACLPLLGDLPEAQMANGQALLASYGPAYSTAMMARWRAKLGLSTAQADDAELVNAWLSLLHASRADFTLSFRRLATVDAYSTAIDTGRDYLADPLGYDAWLARYRSRLQAEHSNNALRRAGMEAVNPLYILRNHHAQTVISAAEQGDYGPMQSLHATLCHPYSEQPSAEAWAQPPPPELAAVAVSCSS